MLLGIDKCIIAKRMISDIEKAWYSTTGLLLEGSVMASGLTEAREECVDVFFLCLLSLMSEKVMFHGRLLFMEKGKVQNCGQ